jgi:hypothetical protein
VAERLPLNLSLQKRTSSRAEILILIARARSNILRSLAKKITYIMFLDNSKRIPEIMLLAARARARARSKSHIMYSFSIKNKRIVYSDSDVLHLAGASRVDFLLSACGSRSEILSEGGGAILLYQRFWFQQQEEHHGK